MFYRTWAVCCTGSGLHVLQDVVLTASMRVNCSATMMGSKDRKLSAGSSSKPLSSCVAKGQPMCSAAEQPKKHDVIL